MGCGASTEQSNAGRANQGKYPNQFFKSNYAPVHELFIEKATSADPVFEVEQLSTVYILRQPTQVELVSRADGSPYEPTTSRTSWALFNDSKSAAKITATFFHAQDIAVLCGADPEGAIEAKEESPFCLVRDGVEVTRKEEGEAQRLIISLTLKPGQTLPFVDGVASGGYMWKCLVDSREGELIATPVEQRTA